MIDDDVLQYETLRLYPPIPALPKWTNQYPQTLTVDGRQLSIPARTAVLTSVLALQMHPKYWEDPLRWRPTRWILSPSSSDNDTTKDDSPPRLDREEILVPREGTYLPWSDGPQHCPGKKFAQVEWVAVIACLLREHRVRIVLKNGENFDQARRRVFAVLEDCESGLILRMRNADDVKLAWQRA